MPAQSTSWNSGFNMIYLEYGYKYYSTNSSSLVASLDRYSASTYYPNYLYALMHPISAGTYRLTFTAYTRKTGTPSDFYVSLYSTESVYYMNNTYQFNGLGTMPIT